MKNTKKTKKPQAQTQTLTVDLLRAVIGGAIATKEECKK